MIIDCDPILVVIDSISKDGISLNYSNSLKLDIEDVVDELVALLQNVIDDPCLRAIYLA